MYIAMNVLFENTRFSLCIIVTAEGRVFYVAVEARLRNSRKNTILFSSLENQKIEEWAN